MEFMTDSTPFQTVQQYNPRNLLFFLASSDDHRSPLLSATPTVHIIKAGSGPVSPEGAVSEVGSGFYKVAATAGDVDTAGDLVVVAVADGADPASVTYSVVGFPGVNHEGWSFTRDTGMAGVPNGYVLGQSPVR